MGEFRKFATWILSPGDPATRGDVGAVKNTA